MGAAGVSASDLGIAPELNLEQEDPAVYDGAAGQAASPEDDLLRSQKIPQNLGGELKQQEYQLILDALIECRGNRQQAAEKLGISPRTLRYKIAKMRDEGMIIPG